jgi:predicted membrane channel-forming protein YqfA (hemolysin III family)
MTPPEPKPRLRGVFHQWAFFASIAAGALLVALAPTGRAAAVAALYAAALAGMFGASALYHRVAWRRPDPLPAVFGFHEVFHLFVVAAAVAHFVAIAAFVVPQG